jgi:hypothetical protein
MLSSLSDRAWWRGRFSTEQQRCRVAPEMCAAELALEHECEMSVAAIFLALSARPGQNRRAVLMRALRLA